MDVACKYVKDFMNPPRKRKTPKKNMNQIFHIKKKLLKKKSKYILKKKK